LHGQTAAVRGKDGVQPPFIEDHFSGIHIHHAEQFLVPVGLPIRLNVADGNQPPIGRKRALRSHPAVQRVFRDFPDRPHQVPGIIIDADFPLR